MINAFTYFKGGIFKGKNKIHYPMLASDYPYTSSTGDDSSDCLYSASKAIKVEVKSYETSWLPTEKKLKAAVSRQPVSVAIAVNSVYIHSYASGIIDAYDCYDHDKKDINPINHGVLVVGYGTDEATGLDYWLLKNSWNTTWGDKGYFKIAFGDKDDAGFCGVHRYPMYPVL